MKMSLSMQDGRHADVYPHDSVFASLHVVELCLQVDVWHLLVISHVGV